MTGDMRIIQMGDFQISVNSNNDTISGHEINSMFYSVKSDDTFGGIFAEAGQAGFHTDDNIWAGNELDTFINGLSSDADNAPHGSGLRAGLALELTSGLNNTEVAVAINTALANGTAEFVDAPETTNGESPRVDLVATYGGPHVDQAIVAKMENADLTSYTVESGETREEIVHALMVLDSPTNNALQNAYYNEDGSLNYELAYKVFDHVIEEGTYNGQPGATNGALWAGMELDLSTFASHPNAIIGPPED